MELKRVVVTGLGAVTPVGNTPEETWKNLLAGVSGAAPITYFDTTLFKTKFACEVKNLDINEYIDRKESRKLDRYTQLAMVSAIQGVKDSGIDLEKEDLNRIGVIYGVGIGGIKTFEDEVKYNALHEDQGPKFSPFFIPKMISDIASGHISIHFGFDNLAFFHFFANNCFGKNRFKVVFDCAAKRTSAVLWIITLLDKEVFNLFIEFKADRLLGETLFKVFNEVIKDAFNLFSG